MIESLGPALDYNGWTYHTIQTEKGLQFRVLPDKPEEYDLEPDNLFKLYALNQFSVDALLNGYLYATHPCQFNDLYDCHPNLIIPDDLNFVKGLLEPFFKITELNALLIKMKDQQEFAKHFFREILYRKVGVISFTVNPHNPLMWAYYTNNQGFCVRFNINKFEFNRYGPFPVNYQKEILPISTKAFGVSNALLAQSNIKSKTWQHEAEYRILAEPEKDFSSPDCSSISEWEGQERKVHYDISCIESIALGNRFFSPKELNVLPDEILDIQLETKENEQRIKILDFIIGNDIDLLVTQFQNDLVSLGFTPGTLKKIKEYHYQVTPKK